MPTDMEYAHAVPGVRAALVLSGISTRADVAKWKKQGGPSVPDFTLPSVSAVVQPMFTGRL